MVNSSEMSVLDDSSEEPTTPPVLSKIGSPDPEVAANTPPSMAINALTNKPPIGLLRDFIVANGGEHQNTLDLKVNGVQLFVETARIYSLETGVTATNTLERFSGLAGEKRAASVDVGACAARIC